VQKKEKNLLTDELAGLGGIGARFAARFLRDDIYKISMDVSLSPPSQFIAGDLADNINKIRIDVDLQLTFVLDRARNILDVEGELLEEEETSEPFEVNGLVGSGAFNMNPALIKISLRVTTDHHICITIEGKAEEGLIKQRAGKKAAQRIAQQLSDELKASKIFSVNSKNIV
jgi:hypothetical protein